MEIGEIVSIVSNVGFPIGLCCYILYLKQKDLENYQQQLTDIQSKHDARESDFANAMQETAKALTELSTLMREGRSNG